MSAEDIQHTGDGSLAPNGFQRYMRAHAWAFHLVQFAISALFFGVAWGLIEHSPTEGIVRGVLWGLLYGIALPFMTRKFSGGDKFTKDQHKLFEKFLLDSRSITIDEHTEPWLKQMLDARRKSSRQNYWAWGVVALMAAGGIGEAVYQNSQHATVVTVGWIGFGVAMALCTVMFKQLNKQSTLRLATAEHVLDTHLASQKISVIM